MNTNTIESMIKSLENHLGVTLKELAIALGIIIIFLILRNIFVKYIFKIVLNITNKTKSRIDDDIIKAYKNPLRVFIVILGLFLALEYLDLSTKINLFVTKFFRSSIVIIIAWGLYNLEGTYSLLHDKMQNKFNIKTNKVVKPFLSKILRTATIAITVGIVAQEFNYNVSGFIAGLGLGGLAIAMAAKDTLSNIFGGVVIIIDKPFDIGDWIEVSDTEGVVEDINFRSTRVRTFSKALVTVPNSKIVDQPIVNYSRRGIRRVNFNLRLLYTTPRDKLEKAIREIEDVLFKHESIDKETIFVKLDGFSDIGFDIFIYFFTSTSNWKDYLNIKEEINFTIIDILEKYNISIAIPSQNLYLKGVENNK